MHAGSSNAVPCLNLAGGGFAERAGGGESDGFLGGLEEKARLDPEVPVSPLLGLPSWRAPAELNREGDAGRGFPSHCKFLESLQTWL